MIVSTGIYVRISSDVTGEGQGVARQEKDCRALVDRLGWTVAGIYNDNDVSAYSGRRRPEYERLLADVEAGRIQAVVAWHADRLHRSPKELERFIDLAERTDLQIQTVTAGPVDLSSPSGRAVARTLGAWGRYESEHRSERITRKLRENAVQGKPHGGAHRPYGWENDRVTPRESEAAVIRECVDRVISGEPMRSIMRDLNIRGIPMATGKPWTHASLLSVLKAARHAGLRRYHDQIIGEAAWPAIVPPETWRAMMRILEDPSRRTTPGRGGKIHLLSVIGRCGICEEALIVAKGREYLGRRKTVYRCRASHVNRTQEHVDDYVVSIILGRLALPSAAVLLHGPDNVPARKAALAEAERVRHQLDEAAEMFTERLIDAAQLRTITAKLRPRLAELETAAAPPPDRARVLGDLIGAEDARAKWEELSIDQRRLVISTLVDVVIFPGGRGRVFRPDGIEVTWKA